MPELPIPRLTATVHLPARRHDLGAVVVTFGARSPATETAAPSRRLAIMCSACGVRGHSSSNRKHHPKVG